MLRRIGKQILYTFIGFSLILGCALLIGTWWLDNAIFSPPRRALQDYHRERLTHPAAFGLRIQRYDCLAGQAPCLLVEPDATAGAGERGRKLRQQLTAKGLSLPAYGTVRGIVVLLHGRNGRKEDLLPVAERFVAAGFRCLIPDLPAHGDSPLPAMAFGSSTFERSLPRRILTDARQHFHLPNEPAVLWGMSMGGAFAVSAASEPALPPDQPWNALMVVSSFSELQPVLDQQVPMRWKMPASVLYPLLDFVQTLHGAPPITAMQPQQWAKQIHLPTLVLHGDHDAFIPIQQGQQLYNRIASPQKHWITVPDGGHGNVLSTAMPLYAEMSTWLLNNVPTQQLSVKY